MADAVEYWLATLHDVDDAEGTFTIGLYASEEAAQRGVAAELQQQADDLNEGAAEGDDLATADETRECYRIEVFALGVQEEATRG